MRREPALDAGGIEEHGEARAGGIPQLGVHLEEGAGDRRTRGAVDQAHACRGVALAHRCGEVHVAPQEVAGDRGAGRVDGGDDGRRRTRAAPGPEGEAPVVGHVDGVGVGRRSGPAQRRVHQHGVGGVGEEREAGHERHAVGVGGVAPRCRCQVRRADRQVALVAVGTRERRGEHDDARGQLARVEPGQERTLGRGPTGEPQAVVTVDARPRHLEGHRVAVVRARRSSTSGGAGCRRRRAGGRVHTRR